MFYGNKAGKEASDKARQILGFDGQQTLEGDDCDYLDLNTSDVPATKQEIDQISGILQKDDEPVDEFIKRTCVWCARCKGPIVEHSMLEFLGRSRGIWLHALQYCIGQDKRCSFRTGLPAWAKL